MTLTSASIKRRVLYRSTNINMSVICKDYIKYKNMYIIKIHMNVNKNYVEYKSYAS